MKHRRLLTLMTAALTAVTVTAFPLASGETACITASAEEDLGNFISAAYPPKPSLPYFYYCYYENSDEAYYRRYAGYDDPFPNRDYTVPSSVEGRTITEIANNAFSNQDSCRSVTIPDTVRRIGELAFYHNSLQTVNIPDSVKTIEMQAFEGSGLTSVTIPAGVETVKKYAFCDCKSLTSVTILGDVTLEESAFLDCPKLTNIQIAPDCKVEGAVAAFKRCPNLVKVNNEPVYTLQKDAAGNDRPVLNPATFSVLKSMFSGSTGVAFVDDYCTAVCNYVVATETASWMNDALKARQLQDWLIRHCEYEDYADGEQFMDRDNHVASSVFLSAGMNARGEGIGESVCVGYAKAYTMLLAAANIESYVIGGSPCIDKGGRAWNAVKIDGKFYQCDVLADDVIGTQSQYGTCYTNFMKNDADMKTLHQCKYGATKMYDDAQDHPLLRKYNNSVLSQVTQCPQSYKDANHDGILDYDFNLSGKWLQYDFLRDLYAYNFMNQYIYPNKSMDEMNNLMDETLYFWFRQQHASFEQFIDNYYGTNPNM